MRRRASILAALFLCAPALTAQRTGPLLDAATIEQQLGSADDAKAVFSVVFAHLRRNKRRELFLSSQIRVEWLPEDDEQQFVRLDEIDAQATLKNCGTYWIVSDVQRAGDVVNVRLVSQCAGTTLDYILHNSHGQWRYGPYDIPDGGGWSVGIGSGFADGPPPECPCLGPR